MFCVSWESTGSGGRRHPNGETELSASFVLIKTMFVSSLDALHGLVGPDLGRVVGGKSTDWSSKGVL